MRPPSAAGRILDSAEGLLAFADKDEAKKAEEAILAVMRLAASTISSASVSAKIAKSLDRVIATRMKNSGGVRKRAQLPAHGKAPELDGPGLPGTSEQDKARIEALFRDN